MRTIRHVTAAAVAAVLLLSPIVTAWSSFGSYEPDTTYDTADYMWAEPGPASGDRIYFNAWSSTQTFVNANVGALETSNEAITMERHSAILGVWIDCNGDGYVGHAESALYEYSSTLLLDDSICPPVTGDVDDWTVGAHNYNGWVSELVSIGWPTTNDDGEPSDTRLYVDPAAKIWADQGLPNAPRVGGTCALNPFPRGTMQSTGGLMNYLDCRYETIEAVNGALALTGDPLGLSYPDPEDAQGSPLDVDTFGDAHSDHAAVTFFDCGAEPAVDGGATFNESEAGMAVLMVEGEVEGVYGDNLVNLWALYDRQVRSPHPEAQNLDDPTLPGQTNATVEEGLEDCDTSNDRGEDFYSLLNEDDWNGDGGDMGKRGATWSFVYHEGLRGMGDVSFRDVVVSEDGAAGIPASFGAAPAYNFFSNGWYGIGNLVKYGPSSVVVRANAADPGADIAPGYFLSFYAHTSTALPSTLKTPGGTGIYGAAQCGDNTSGVHNGWNCDASTWNRNPDGSLVPDSETLAFVGDVYTLRDIDCYDGSTDLGVGIGLPYYGESPCPRPS